MSEKTITNDAVDLKSNPVAPVQAFGINDIDMRPSQNGAGDRNRNETSVPAGFNHIEISTVDRVADKDGFISKDSLGKAAKDPTLDSIQKDDVQHMLNNFQLLAGVVDDKDGGKKGISREDIAKYNFPHEMNHIETSSISKLSKAADGSITKEALEKGLKRQDLSDVERDDMEYLQRQYNNVRGFAKGGAPQGVGISGADIAEFNKRAENYAPDTEGSRRIRQDYDSGRDYERDNRQRQYERPSRQ